MSDILDLIDGALEDFTVSADAARWVPDDAARELIDYPVRWVTGMADAPTGQIWARLWTHDPGIGVSSDAAYGAVPRTRAGVFEWSPAEERQGASIAEVLLDDTHAWLEASARKRLRERRERLSCMRTAYRRRKR